MLEAKALGEYPDLYWALDALNLHRRVWMFNIRGRWLFCQFKSRKSFFLCMHVYMEMRRCPLFLAVHETTCGITPIFLLLPTATLKSGILFEFYVFFLLVSFSVNIWNIIVFCF